MYVFRIDPCSFGPISVLSWHRITLDWNVIWARDMPLFCNAIFLNAENAGKIAYWSFLCIVYGIRTLETATTSLCLGAQFYHAIFA